MSQDDYVFVCKKCGDEIGIQYIPEDKLGTLEEAIEFDKKRNYQYTAPRELSDKEILDLCPPNHSEMMNEAYTIDFARAILKKASEK